MSVRYPGPGATDEEHADWRDEVHQSRVDEARAEAGETDDDRPGIFTVFERQVITYAWDVKADNAEHAESSVDDGVPDSARQVRFSSDTWTERAENDVEPDVDLTEED